MDDLMQRIQEMLSDEESMKQISEIAQQLGGDDASASGLPPLGALLGSAEPDNNAGLLLALRPFLSDERQKKADKAMKLMRVLKLAQSMKDSGFLDSI